MLKVFGHKLIILKKVIKKKGLYKKANKDLINL